MNTSRILDAVLFASKAHAGQFRKFGPPEPYVNHCIRVAKTVADTVWKRHETYEDMIIAALFHDVFEDCPQVSQNDVLEKFGEQVFVYVGELTDSPLYVGNRRVRKKLDNKRLAAACWEVQTIKYGDILDNVPTIVKYDPDFAPKFIQEKMELISVMNKGHMALYEKTQKVIYDAYAEINNLHMGNEI